MDRLQARHDVVGHIAQLAECQEIVEALEDDVLPTEVRAQPAVLQPVVDERSIGIRDSPIDDGLHTAVNPLLERLARVAHTHVVVTDDL